jgi:hypothetical protein
MISGEREARVQGNVLGTRLDKTVTARWRRRLAGSGPEHGRHWRTKTAYYAAAGRLLAAGEQLTWSTIAAAVEPRGSRSTFYEVTGPHAKHPLIRELTNDESVDSLQLAHYYRRASPIDQLIDETKVWTYWPYRECLVLMCRADPDLDRNAAVDLLAACVDRWTRRNPAVAAALEAAPPVCAVEDLLALRPGQFSAVHAVGVLAKATQGATVTVGQAV